MTEQQISDLLYDLKFSETESEAFMDMIEYAKECQESLSLSNLKPHINQTIERVISNEN